MKQKQDNTHLINTLTSIHKQLTKRKLISELYYSPSLPDEAKMHIYQLKMDHINNHSDGNIATITAGGYSFSSKEEALLKCLIEGIERYSMVCYRKKNFTKAKYSEFSTEALDPCLYISNKGVQNNYFYWTMGFNLFTGAETFIPAQLVYYSYTSGLKEPQLTELVSTGGAGGLNHNFTLLQGIYEVVEKDAFMSMYLLKRSCPRINLSSLTLPALAPIIASCERYNLELLLFDITNDLEIPSFLSVLRDKTGLGPAVTFGLKSSLDPARALLGAVEESFHTRPWIKKELFEQKNISSRIIGNKIQTFIDRAVFWLERKRIAQLSFLLDQPYTEMRINTSLLSEEEQLKTVIKLFRSRSIPLFYTLITPDFFQQIGGSVYKVIAPTLQPLYFNERKPFINTKRLKMLADYFQLSSSKINTTPHPIL